MTGILHGNSRNIALGLYGHTFIEIYKSFPVGTVTGENAANGILVTGIHHSQYAINRCIRAREVCIKISLFRSRNSRIFP